MYAYVLYKGLAYSVSFQLVTENISVMIKYFLVSCVYLHISWSGQPEKKAQKRGSSELTVQILDATA